MAKKLRITQVRSVVGRKFDQKATLKALGIKKMNDTVVKDNTPQIRGMIRKINHLLSVEEVEEKKKSKAKKKKTSKSKKKTTKSKKKSSKKTKKKKEIKDNET